MDTSDQQQGVQFVFLIDDRLHWSASDLTAAAECEYSVLRTLDYKLRRAQPIEAPADPLMEHISRLGDRHEADLVRAWQARGELVSMRHLQAPYTDASLTQARDATYEALSMGRASIHQAAFFDGEFFGYADFVESSEDGWVVCDAKLARRAKPKALLQLGAYADQVRKLGLPLAPTLALLLGSGERLDFPVADVLPVFEERRERLRNLLSTHVADESPATWGDDRFAACGSCAECQHAATMAGDVILVAGLRMEQRSKLRTSNITTVAELASATASPGGMADSTFEKLRAQAVLQWRQMQQGEGAPTRYELTATAPKTLALLPAPSAGDLFFDFEGDPLYDEGDPARTGLEYLWGFMGPDEKYTSIWAHSSLEERTAFVDFMELVAERRRAHPDMHVYHYAPYETSALKRLAMRYQTKEKALDDLLRSEVFVDLYATVRGSVRVSAPSYSIKKLEPLYMGDELRDENGVQAGDASILAYHEFRDTRVSEPAAAGAQLIDLEAYNAYDCLSTLRLRDWLLERAEEAGVSEKIVPRIKDVQGEELSDQDPTFRSLMAKAGPAQRTQRNPDQQANAMLAVAIDYYRRERKQFWWDHFARLHHPVQEWANARDVFVVESVEVVQDWAVPEGRARNARRVLRLTGDWAAGSKPTSAAHVVYGTPCPPGVDGPDGAPHGAGSTDTLHCDDKDPRVVLLTESRKPADAFGDHPIALTPSAPPGTQDIEAAILEVATRAATAASLPNHAATDILTRTAPRLRSGDALPQGGPVVDDVVTALVGMDDSYVAIQGPPGTGKTYNGSRIIQQLVQEHGWRIGVVAQSHATVENMLGSIVDAGLDPALVGKNDNDDPAPTWTALKKGVEPRAEFLGEHVDTGCVLGGTAWTFANSNLIERCGLDLLVVDEAGQFSLAPTIGAAASAKRLLLLGDPQQLPQVSQGVHAEPVDESALGWLMGEHDTLPPEYGYFLADSYRMHPALCERVSVLSYEGRLQAASPASQRALKAVSPGLEVVHLAHTGNRTDSVEEACEVVAQVHRYLGMTWTDPRDAASPRPLDECDFLVVAPYNAQVALIRKELGLAGLRDVRVGTVDKFQGKEAPIAIVSMTASSPGDVPRGMGFLLSRNRVNVAVSRAEWKAILIRSDALTSYMPASVEGLLELGAFVGLCER